MRYIVEFPEDDRFKAFKVEFEGKTYETTMNGINLFTELMFILGNKLNFTRDHLDKYITEHKLRKLLLKKKPGTTVESVGEMSLDEIIVEAADYVQIQPFTYVTANVYASLINILEEGINEYKDNDSIIKEAKKLLEAK